MTAKSDGERDYDFFISFSNQDLGVVQPVVQAMDEQYGATCWFQEKDSRAEFVDAIMSGIEHAGAFVVFISPHSANSYFVLNEINHAVEWKLEHEDFKIVPVLIDPDGRDISDPVYKRVRFYLGRLNITFYKRGEPLEELIRKIFDQAEYEVKGDTLRQSLYHHSLSESVRLRAQNEILRDFSHEFFQKYVTAESYILDVGCADGENIALRLNGLQYAGLLGVDIDGGQTERAAAAHGSDKNEFRACDILSDEFDDILSDYIDEKDIKGFDIIHISAVLLHLSDPVKLLRVLRRFLKKNGYLFIQDEDDGANLVYPEYKFFNRAFDIWADSKESGDRHCGRKIPSYLSAAGYKSCVLAKCGVSDVGLESGMRTALWDIYFNYHLWLAAEENMFYNPVKTNRMIEEYKAEYDARKEEYDEGKIFLQLGFLFFVAKK